MTAKLKRRLLAAVALSLSLAACSGGDASTGEVRPFSEVQATEFVFEPDVTNLSRSIFRVTTTEPMICAIVWGETEALGNFNNSLAMNGTGIVQHDVFLPGAEAGVEYFFKVQGSTADGKLYESEMATFIIPATDVESPIGGDAIHGLNLALDAIVIETSSEFSAAWAAVNALDGDDSTEWATAGSGDNAYITIDLGSVQEIAGVEFVTRSMADGSAITEEYTVTIDEEPFGPFPAGNLADPRFAPLVATGRIVRFDVTSTSGGNTGAIEVRVLAPTP